MNITRWILILAALALVACGGGDGGEGETSGDEGAVAGDEMPPETEPTGDEPLPDTAPTERPTMTAEECEAQGATVVGDIGDGAIHQPDYVCPSGQPPIATVPLGIEGSVCCPD